MHGCRQLACCTGALVLAACAPLAPEGSPVRVEREARISLMRSCLRTPELYGFTYTRKEVVDLSMYTPTLIDSLYGHCAAVVRVAIR